MSMNEIRAMREKRVKLWEAAKAFVESRKDVSGTLSAEDSATYDQMEADVIRMGKERKWKYWYKLPFIQYGEAAADVPVPEIALGSRLLKRGMVGSDVKALQELLMQLGYALPKYGADSEFGAETEKALQAFQKKAGLEADGKYGDKTHAVLMDAVADDDGQPDTPEQPVPDEPAPVGTTVVIVSEGGKVNVRCGNGTEYERLSAVAPGSTFPLVATAQNGWHAIAIGSRVGWVSGKLAKII